MEDKITAAAEKMKIPYRALRILLILFLVMMFFPQLNPAAIITKSGQAKVSTNISLFTCSISYSSLISGLERGLDKGWVQQGTMYFLFAACVASLAGIVIAGVGGCMSVGNHRMRSVGNRFLVIGGIVMTVSIVGIFAGYQMIASTSDADKITYHLPVGIYVFAIVAILFLLCSIVVFCGTPKSQKGEKMEMESKYQLFLMLLPFLLLVFAFSYLPLYSWRYAFFDYTSGTQLSMDDFVGFKWFKLLVQNATYAKRLLRVLRNTLAMSGLGLLTSWLPMVFAIFLNEMKSKRWKRMIQTFSTIPNFISWVLVYAIAVAIFSTDGFVNTIINSMGGNSTTNYLMSSDFSWLKMLAWGTWKGVGWSAIIYISGISGIDQQLYEAATVDGAGRFQRMRHVTLPGLLPTYVVMLVMQVAGVLSNGMDQYLVFSNAQNSNALEVLDLYVYNLGIDSGMIPLSTVVGMTKSIVSVILLFVANNVSKAIRGDGVV